MTDAVTGVLGYWALSYTFDLPPELYITACTLWLKFCWVLHETDKHNGKK